MHVVGRCTRPSVCIANISKVKDDSCVRFMYTHIIAFTFHKFINSSFIMYEFICDTPFPYTVAVRMTMVSFPRENRFRYVCDVHRHERTIEPKIRIIVRCCATWLGASLLSGFDISINSKLRGNELLAAFPKWLLFKAYTILQLFVCEIHEKFVQFHHPPRSGSKLANLGIFMLPLASHTRTEYFKYFRSVLCSCLFGKPARQKWLFFSLISAVYFCRTFILRIGDWL